MNIYVCKWLLLLSAMFIVPLGTVKAQNATDKKTVPFTWASGINATDPTFTSASVASELGYFTYGKVKLDVTITDVAGGAGTIPIVESESAQVGYTGSEAMLLTAARGVDTGMEVFFDQNRANIFKIGVLPDSKVKTIADLKGTSIGVRVMPSAMSFYITGLLKSMGMVADKDFQIISVGAGGGSISELEKGNISAFVNSDTLYAAMENAGAKFRYLDPGEYAKHYSSGGIFAKRSYLASHKDEACAFGRGLAEGVEFALANPDAAVQLHWKHYPEAKPKGDDPLGQAKHILVSHLPIWDPSLTSDPRHGASATDEWLAVAKALGLTNINAAAVNKLFTNDFVPCFNDFDHEKLRAEARAYKF